MLPGECFRQQLPKVRRQGPSSHSSLDGRLSSELLGGQQAVEAVQDAGQTHSFPPQGGRDGVNSAEFRDQNLTQKSNFTSLFHSHYFTAWTEQLIQDLYTEKQSPNYNECFATCLFCRLSHFAFLFSALLRGKAFPFWFKCRGVSRFNLRTKKANAGLVPLSMGPRSTIFHLRRTCPAM